MIRNQQYRLHELKPGDRFYFAGDRKKTIYTVNDIHPFEYKIQKGFRIQYCNCRQDLVPLNGLQVIPFKADRRIIFLRNINDKL